ncbi:chitin deacetylase 8-like [Arctopsyche grandis]|uniref:chitin deacetylase 8-like n=1 Tax=Arctopsyche grandis TaxID=121162 RepID=UPI00406D6889
MKVLIVLLGLAVCAYALPAFFDSTHDNGLERAPAVQCNVTACKLPNCLCSGVTIPGNITAAQTPQFVMLTFDDAVTIANINFYREALQKRKNPDNCSIAATFFVAHEYTDYSLVHELRATGHEIALHSISHESNIAYWRDASLDTLNKEFADQKTMMAHFANIAVTDIKGIRMPFLQMAGNNQFQMLKNNNFQYDLTWTTQKYISPGLWPYTTEFSSIQECLIPPCPTESIPNVWAIPMINWVDQEGAVCSMVDACVNVPNTTNALLDWMKGEFNKQYTGNRAPLGFFVHAAWFTADEMRFETYLKFLDYLATLKDVFIVSGSQVIDWIKAPKTVAQMIAAPSCPKPTTTTCSPRACQLIKEGTVERWLTSCVSQCPNSYPWLGNPLGEK